MSTPPDQPGSSNADKRIEQQLDELLIQIEEVEPGIIDPLVLPSSYRDKAEAAREEQEKVAATTQAPIETAEEPAAAAPEPAAAETTPEQADMLASLNAALQGLSGDPPADEPSEPEAQPAEQAAPDAAEPAEELSMEEKLQQEIAALMNAEPQVEVTATPEPATEGAATEEAGQSTEDQIAMEIEGLLNAEQDATASDTEADKEKAIDELDKMLASEIDADGELTGEFQTVEDVTAGIQVEVPTEPSTDDAHAATARDVAAELDSQPEDLPATTPEPVAATAEQPAEDPFAVLAEIAETAEVSEADYQEQLASQKPKRDYRAWFETAKDRLFTACYAINWPARRLSTEWRANLGYIALLNLFFGVGLWIVLILF